MIFWLIAAGVVIVVMLIVEGLKKLIDTLSKP
jgi:hypothetical protein